MCALNPGRIRPCRIALSLAALMGWISIAPALTGHAHAEVRLPHIISDHAVLQRDAPIHIWGWSNPKETVQVQFHAQKRTATANEFGEWGLWLAPESAGGPYTLAIQGETGAPISYTDMLVGDVWFASGQSNMEMPLKGFADTQSYIKNGDAEIAAATLPQVRLLRVDHKTSSYPQQDLAGSWTLCTPATAADFSAVAYFFGREIQQKEHVPIGLIDSTWGGTPVEAWTSFDALAADASLMPALASWARFADQQSNLDAVKAAEKHEDAAAEAAHQPKPQHPWHPFPESWGPAQLYNGMIAPATPYTIKGVIWYQGETNSAPDRAPLYSKLFSTMIADWRRDWHQGEFPFLYVQISSFNSPGESWGMLRDQQRRTLSVADTAMAVTLDVGNANNVHPPDKETVGARLALAAEAMVYEKTDKTGRPAEYSGPLFREMTREDAKARVYFDHTGVALHAKGPELTGFELAGRDHKFFPASAVIDGQTVVVSSPQVPEPAAVRYAWPGFTTANLYNDVDLPASTFTSE
jgi:sialate O-acetylesterase